MSVRWCSLLSYDAGDGKTKKTHGTNQWFPFEIVVFCLVWSCLIRRLALCFLSYLQVRGEGTQDRRDVGGGAQDGQCRRQRRNGHEGDLRLLSCPIDNTHSHKENASAALRCAVRVRFDAADSVRWKEAKALMWFAARPLPQWC